MASRATPDLTGKVVLITGGNSGIGRETAVSLASMGATTVITSRNPAKGSTAADDIRRRAGSDRVEVMPLDLADLVKVRAFAADFLDRFDRLDVLVNNAGGILSSRRTTVQGFEMTFGVNHLGHFLLTDLLRERLVASAPARVITVASLAHRVALSGMSWNDLQSERSYSPMDAYGQSKLANILFTTELARRLEGTGVTANCLHPGAVRTGFGGADDTSGLERIAMMLGSPFLINATRGARTTVFLASAPEVAERTGGYWVNCRPHRPSRQARDPEAARRLWEISEQLIEKVSA